MSNNLGVGKILELVEGLKSTVRELTGRGDKLNQDFQAGAARERRLRETVAEEHATRLSAAIDEAEATFTSTRDATAGKHEARRARIGKAYQASKEKTLGDVENETGTRKYELQKRMLQAERDRATGLTGAATALEEFKASLAAEQAALAPLETAAHSALKGYGRFVRCLSDAYQKAAPPGVAQDENQMLAELRDLLGKTRGDLGRFQRFWLLRVFKYLPVWVLLVLCEFALVLQQTGLNSAGYTKAVLGAFGSLVLILILRFAARGQAEPLATTIAGEVGKARRLHDTALERSEVHYQQELERLKHEFVTTTQTVDQQLKQTLAEAGERRVGCRMAADEKASRALETNTRQRRVRLEALERWHAAQLELLKRTAETRRKAELEASEKREAKLNTDYQAQWLTLEADWKQRLQPIYEALDSANTTAAKLFPPWEPRVLETWRPPSEFAAAAQFAKLDVEVEKLSETKIKDKRLALPGPARFSVPLCLALSGAGLDPVRVCQPGPRRGYRRA